MQIVLFNLHEKQKEVRFHPARYRVVCAGRRFGKSMLAMHECLDVAINQQKVVWWVSPTYNNVEEHWRTAKNTVGGLYTQKSEQRKFMIFDKGELHFKSGDKPDNLRGSGIDLCVIDEAAFIKDELWNAVLRPSLSDRKGRALFISTPNGAGTLFHRLWLRGQEGNNPDWVSWRFPTTENTFIPGIEDEVRDAKKTMPAAMFAQEYLAEFRSAAGGVFVGVEDAATAPLLDGPVPGRLYVAGIDLGRKHDYTVVSIVDIESGEQAALYRFTDVGFSLQAKRIGAIIEQWGILRAYMESNFAGGFIEELQEQGYPVVGVFMTFPTKAAMIEALAINLQKGQLKLLSANSQIGSIQLGEFQAYTMRITASGNIRYGAPRGWHDDTVMATALANRGLVGKSRGMKIVPNPFFSL